MIGLWILLMPGALGAPDLTWSVDGTSVLLEDSPGRLACGRQRLDAATMALAPEPEGEASPSGAGRLVIRDGVATYQRLDGGSVATPLPVLVRPVPGNDQPRIPSLGTWLDERSYLWCQRDDDRGEGGCALLRPAEGRAEVLSPGQTPDLTYAWQVRPGPSGWLALFRSPEGHLEVELLRHTGREIEAAGPAMPSLYDCGPLNVHFSSGGRAVWLITPCTLAERPDGHPCMGLDGTPLFEMGTPWRWYTWMPGQEGLRLLRADLPAHAAPHPDGTGLAWATDDIVCVGEPACPEAARCVYLPRRLPAGDVCPGG